MSRQGAGDETPTYRAYGRSIARLLAVGGQPWEVRQESGGSGPPMFAVVNGAGERRDARGGIMYLYRDTQYALRSATRSNNRLARQLEYQRSRQEEA